MDVDVMEVIKGVDDKKPVEKLLLNERNKRIIHQGSCFYMINKKTGKYEPLKGLLPSLKKAFWPETNFYTVSSTIAGQKRKRSNTSTRRRGRNNKNIKQIAVPHNKGRHFGSIRGSQVHKQLEDFILLDKKNFDKKYGRLHIWTKRILLYIIEQEWQPIFSEFHIFDEDLRIATSIDMICITPEGKLIILEFKTGYSGYWRKSNKGERISGPLKSIMANNPLNRAKLQLAFSMLFLIKHHQIVNMEGWIIRIDQKELEAIKLDCNFLRIYSKSMYKHLEKRMIQK
jgi:hypothetical protein